LPRDEAYLLDIHIAARKALAFVEGLPWDAFAASDLHQNAVVRTLEVIGEAAGRVSEATREEHPQVHWVEMIGMRNQLIHDYASIDLGLVWQTPLKGLPRPVELIEPLVSSDHE